MEEACCSLHQIDVYYRPRPCKVIWTSLSVHLHVVQPQQAAKSKQPLSSGSIVARILVHVWLSNLSICNCCHVMFSWVCDECMDDSLRVTNVAACHRDSQLLHLVMVLRLQPALSSIKQQPLPQARQAKRLRHPRVQVQMTRWTSALAAMLLDPWRISQVSWYTGASAYQNTDWGSCKMWHSLNLVWEALAACVAVKRKHSSNAWSQISALSVRALQHVNEHRCNVQPAKKAKLDTQGAAGCSAEAHQMSTSTNSAGSYQSTLVVHSLHMPVVGQGMCSKIVDALV